MLQINDEEVSEIAISQKIESTGIVLFLTEKKLLSGAGFDSGSPAVSTDGLPLLPP